MDNFQKFSGLWHNQYGSEVDLAIDSSGRVSGKFLTKVGRSEIPRELWENYWFDVVGFVNGDLISFVVCYTSTGALSAVSGRYVSAEKSKSGVKQIKTMGYTAFNVSDQDIWRGTSATSVIYEPGPANP